MNLTLPLEMEITGSATEGVKKQAIWDIIVQSSESMFGLVINVILALMLGYAIFIFV